MPKSLILQQRPRRSRTITMLTPRKKAYPNRQIKVKCQIGEDSTSIQSFLKSSKNSLSTTKERPRSQPKNSKRKFRIPSWVSTPTSTDIVRSFVTDDTSGNCEIYGIGQKYRNGTDHHSEQNDGRFVFSDRGPGTKSSCQKMVIEMESFGEEKEEQKDDDHFFLEIIEQINSKLREFGLSIDFDLESLMKKLIRMQENLSVEKIENMFAVNQDDCSVARYACFRIVMSLLERD